MLRITTKPVPIRKRAVVGLALAIMATFLILQPAATLSASAQVGTLTVSPGGPYTGQVNAPITFSAQAFLNGVAISGATYTWTFGDGGVGVGQAVTHPYTAAGTYNVSVTAVASTGEFGSATTTATVGTTGPLSVTTGGPYTGPPNTSITMTAQATANGVPVAATYTWTFGDGGVGVGQTVAHAYTATGSYTVSVAATTATGETGVATTTATIGVIGGLTVSIGGPYSGQVGSVITFTAQAYEGNVPVAATYSWSFGDGTVAAGQTVTRAYASAGTFSASVTATTATGQTASASTSVVIIGGGVLSPFNGPFTAPNFIQPCATTFGAQFTPEQLAAACRPLP